MSSNLGFYVELTLAKELSHPFSLTHAMVCAAHLHHYRREGQVAQEWAEATITLASDQGFPFYSAMGTVFRGWALAQQGRAEEGTTQIHQGLVAFRATGAEMYRPYFLVLLAESYGERGQAEDELSVLAEALDLVQKTGERRWAVEAYRLKGTLTLQKFQVLSSKFQVQESPKSEVRSQRLKDVF